MTLRRASLAFSFGLIACSSPSSGGNDDAGSSTSTAVGTSGGETSTSTPPADSSTSTTAQPETGGGSSSSSTTEVDPTFVFDMGVLPDSPIVEDPGCHAVDFLFVIDNSGSMADDQAKL